MKTERVGLMVLLKSCNRHHGVICFIAYVASIYRLQTS